MFTKLPASRPRRDFLYGLGASLGAAAFTSMLAEAAGGDSAQGPHFPAAKAKHCIFLYMEGGPSHIDTFDPKPKLKQLHLKEFTRSGEKQSAMSSGKRYYVESPVQVSQGWRKRRGHVRACGKTWPASRTRCVSIAVARSNRSTIPPPIIMSTADNRFGGDPSIGAWVNYGLGSENEDLPGFIVLPELAYPQGGAANWSNGFLPTALQGTPLRPKGSPILDIEPPPGITRDHQRKNLDFLAKLNQRHAALHPEP